MSVVLMKCALLFFWYWYLWCFLYYCPLLESSPFPLTRLGDLKSLLAHSLILLLLQIKRKEPVLPCGLSGIKSNQRAATCELLAATQGESFRHWALSAPRALIPASPLRHVPSVHVGNVPSDNEMPKGLSKRADPPTPPPPSVNTPCCCFHAHLLAVGCLTSASLRHPPLCFHPHVVEGRHSTCCLLRLPESSSFVLVRAARMRTGTCASDEAPEWHAKIASNLLPHSVRLSCRKK